MSQIIDDEISSDYDINDIDGTEYRVNHSEFNKCDGCYRTNLKMYESGPKSIGCVIGFCEDCLRKTQPSLLKSFIREGLIDK